MQVIILGYSKVGKSTMAANIQKIFPTSVIYEAGAWARKEFAQLPNIPDIQDPAYIEQMSVFATEKLRKYPRYSIWKYEQFCYDNHDSMKIIVGVRNPFDFMEMVHSEKTLVISIHGNCEPHSKFEEGLSVIWDYIKWNQSTLNTIQSTQVFQIDVDYTNPEFTEFLHDRIWSVICQKSSLIVTTL